MSIEALTLAKIANMVNGTLKGDGNYVVVSISSPDAPCPGSLSPLWEKKLVPFASPDAVLLDRKSVV